MLISGCRGDINALPVNCPGFVNLAELFQGLATVEITGGVVRIVAQQQLELFNGCGKPARIYIFHGQSVAGKGIRRFQINH